MGAPFGAVDGVNPTATPTPPEKANQAMRLELGAKDAVKPIRIGFTDQRLTASGGLAVRTRYIAERGLVLSNLSFPQWHDPGQAHGSSRRVGLARPEG
jgi:hypothetical protein